MANKYNPDFVFIAFVDGLIKGTYGKGTMIASDNKSVIVPTSLIRKSTKGQSYLKGHKDMTFKVRTTAFNEETKRYESIKEEVMTSLQLHEEMKSWSPTPSEELF